MNKAQVKGRADQVKGKIKNVSGTIVGNKKLQQKEKPRDRRQSRGQTWGSQRRCEEERLTRDTLVGQSIAKRPTSAHPRREQLWCQGSLAPGMKRSRRLFFWAARAHRRGHRTTSDRCLTVSGIEAPC